MKNIFKFLWYLLSQPVKEIIEIGTSTTLSRNVLMFISIILIILITAGIKIHITFVLICVLGALAFHIKREYKKWKHGLAKRTERDKLNIPSAGEIKKLKEKQNGKDTSNANKGTASVPNEPSQD